MYNFLGHGVGPSKNVGGRHMTYHEDVSAREVDKQPMYFRALALRGGSVCMSVVAKTDEPIQAPFWEWTRGGPRNHAARMLTCDSAHLRGSYPDMSGG